MRKKFEENLLLLENIANRKIDLFSEIHLNEINTFVNNSLENSIIYDFVNSKIQINQNYDFNKDISEDILKDIINFSQKNGDTYTYFNCEIFHSNNHLNKKILFYFKTIELITSYFIVNNKQTILIYFEYTKYIYNLIELFRLKTYEYLGLEKVPPYKVWNYKTQTMSEVKSRDIGNAISSIQINIDSYRFEKNFINIEIKDFLVKYYNLWWEKYKEYIDKNFQALGNKLEYYNGLNIDIYFCKFEKMDEIKFGNSDLALCVGMSKNNNGKINIKINEKINQILFLNEIYNDINDVVVTVAFDIKTYDNDLSKIINTEIPDKVNSSILGFFKEIIDYENYIKFAEKIFEEIGHISLNKSNTIVIENYITNEKTFYELEYSENTSKEIVEDLSKRKKKEHNLIIINKDVLNNNMKKKYIKENIFIKDIDDIFYMYEKLKRKYSILKDFIYPYLEKQVGLINTNDNEFISNSLINELKKCPLGKEGWKQFENIIDKILKFVFKDSFRNFLLKAQSRNMNGTDIKDYIITNNGIHDFWNTMKIIYKSNNIIIECKNYKDEIGIDELRQVSDYLSKDTYGQFGIIFSRKGLNISGKEKQKDYLNLNPKKMILVLDEEDIIDLIRARVQKEAPEEILEVKKLDAELLT